MTITKNLGGDRIGSGNKMNISMHNYERSTHDLSRVWRSTMSAGTLVPFMTEIALPGDTFDIDLTTLTRTMPTLTPLFGSFKLQLDVYQIPMRLYHASLHMNRLGIGLRMADIKLPLMKISAKGDKMPDMFDQSSLMSYLGVRGAPLILENAFPIADETFKKQALFLLSYWDIYKNYYANKQEEIGFVLVDNQIKEYNYTSVQGINTNGSTQNFTFSTTNNVNTFNVPMGVGNSYQFPKFQMIYTGVPSIQDLQLQVEGATEQSGWFYAKDYFNIEQAMAGTWILTPKSSSFGVLIGAFKPDGVSSSGAGLAAQAFQLKNIDNVHLSILKQDEGTPFILNETTPAPYPFCTGFVTPTHFYPQYTSQGGLGIKTYQSDIFQNWLKTEYIDGEGGINEITAIATDSGSFTLDTLNLSKKVYDMLNRVAVSGGSYYDWQEAVYGEKSFSMAESPIYEGGMSTEIIFEEVVATADQTDSPLGSLAGKGTQSNSKKGGKVVIHVKEPAMIMGIVSITPRIDYSQGNKWFTRLETMDDLHKPALDGIGFQELITDQMVASDAIWDTDTMSWKYKSAGKQPAWINYMTAYNETYGHFAESSGENALMQMTLNRQYEWDENAKTIADLTTYIDPVKYNYAFATTDITAQNFWVQIGLNVTARRKMSAKIIPNL